MSDLSINHQSTTVSHSLLCAIACFIPLPFVDEYTQTKIGNRMFNKILDGHGQPNPSAANILSRRYGSWCMGCIVSLFVYPVKKLIRTVALFLTVGNVVLECEYWISRGIILDVALAKGWVPSDDESAEQLRLVMKRSKTELDSGAIYSGLKNIFSTSRREFFSMWRGVVKWVRGEKTIKEILPDEIVLSVDSLVSDAYIKSVVQFLEKTEVIQSAPLIEPPKEDV